MTAEGDFGVTLESKKFFPGEAKGQKKGLDVLTPSYVRCMPPIPSPPTPTRTSLPISGRVLWRSMATVAEVHPSLGQGQGQLRLPDRHLATGAQWLPLVL